MKKDNVKKRFLSHTEKTDACWNWSAHISKTGYGQFWHNGKLKLAHRVSLEIFGNKPGTKMHVDHKCKNRRCVNPNHLRVVTPKINALENSVGFSAINKKKTHCLRGHEFTKENTRMQLRKGNTGRSCRECERVRQRIADIKIKSLQTIRSIRGEDME